MAQTYFQSYIPLGNNSNNREANAGEAEENRKRQQKQEEKTDQQNNFLTMLATMQLLNGMGNQNPWNVLGMGVGSFLAPLAYKGGTDLLTKWGLIKPSDATGANSMNQDAINNSINRYSVHQNPNLGNSIPDNQLIIKNPAEQFKPDFSLLGDLNSLGGIQRMLNENIEKERNNMNFWGFGNNPLNRYSGR